MRRIFAAAATGVAVMLLTSTAPANAAGRPPSAACYGQIIAGISSTWPWAHDGRLDFSPPPGAVAKWIQEFGDQVGVTSVRQLQLFFCNE